ncbi:hypothetical protein AMTRI_Chr08g168790 [Amborella trichopoda]
MPIHLSIANNLSLSLPLSQRSNALILVFLLFFLVSSVHFSEGHGFNECRHSHAHVIPLSQVHLKEIQDLGHNDLEYGKKKSNFLLCLFDRSPDSETTIPFSEIIS